MFISVVVDLHLLLLLHIFRLRIALSAVHTTDDLKKLISALSSYINFQDIDSGSLNIYSKL